LYVLNADQQLADYTLVGKKGAASLEKTKDYCLYLDEIIDVRMLSEERAIVCSNNEMLKVVQL